jgi:aldose 1-epimerase
MGAICGRFAGRIVGNNIYLHNKNINNDNILLHSGVTGFHHQIAQAKIAGDDSLNLTFFSPDGDEGFTGNLTVIVNYKLDNDNNFIINYNATTDKDSLINPTSHIYYNLSGNLQDDITSHFLKLNSSKYFTVNSNNLPAVSTSFVKNTIFDFNTNILLDNRITAANASLLNNGGYDHYFFLEGGQSQQAILTHPRSGRVMNIYTTSPGIVVYTKNNLSGRLLMTGRPDKPRDAICLEAQNPPLGFNSPYLNYSLLKPGRPWQSTTCYQFLVTR